MKRSLLTFNIEFYVKNMELYSNYFLTMIVNNIDMQRNIPDVIITVDKSFMWELGIRCDAIS